MIWDRLRQYEKRKILNMMAKINIRLDVMEVWQCEEFVKHDEDQHKVAMNKENEKEDASAIVVAEDGEGKERSSEEIIVIDEIVAIEDVVATMERILQRTTKMKMICC